jgi:hypothetical protein
MSLNEPGVLRSWRWTRNYTILHHTSTFSSANSQFFNDVSLVVEPGNELVLTFTPTPEPEQILLVTAIAGLIAFYLRRRVANRDHARETRRANGTFCGAIALTLELKWI